MFDMLSPEGLTGVLPDVGRYGELDEAALVEVLTGLVRMENAVCARKLAAAAELFVRRTGCVTAEDRADWWLDPTRAVAAELSAALRVGAGRALAQAHRGVVLRDRFPKLGMLFELGLVSEATVRTIVARTDLITDPAALAAVDGELAARAPQWARLSEQKTAAAVDAIVLRHDPGGLRRSERKARGADVDFGSRTDPPGFTSIWALLASTDAAAGEQRLDALARAVCPDDPRSIGERRRDALAALLAGRRPGCRCGRPDCPAPAADPPDVVVHVVADAGAVTGGPDDTVAGAAPYGYVFGRGVLPAPLLRAVLERARILRVRHPGPAPTPEPGYRPSAALAEFVRCRDLTCRFPNCDRPATACDLDHTVPYPLGPTHPSNLKCLCREHHLLKTFWGGPDGWRDEQHPDGTVVWTAPTGHRYVTRPGSALHFPALCEPTGPLHLPAPPPRAGRGVMMPRRGRSRAEQLARRIAAERRENAGLVDELSRPPPF